MKKVDTETHTSKEVNEYFRFENLTITKDLQIYDLIFQYCEDKIDEYNQELERNNCILTPKAIELDVEIKKLQKCIKNSYYYFRAECSHLTLIK